MDISKLLSPRSIAVIGANDKPGFGRATCTNLLRSAGDEHIYFINPRREEVLGKACYKHISELPEQVDLCVIILNKNLVAEALEDAAKCGCGAAVIYASGYGETGDKAEEQKLRELAARLDMAVMGVNCAGFINANEGVYPFGMLFDQVKKGGIAIISQSGKICLNMTQVEYMGFSYLISSGNSTCLLIEDYMDYLIDDEGTKVIGLYMEGIKDPEKFVSVLRRAAEKRKPIVILKVGRSAKGSRVASSHTGSLSGSDKSFDAVCKKFGIIRVDDIEELVQTCHLLSTLPMLPANTGFSAMCLSGGETGVCADMGAAMGIDFPDFTDETLERLRALLPDYASPANPLDMTATLAHDGEKYAEVIRTIMDDPNIGMVLCGQTVLPKHKTTDVIYPMSDGMVMAANERRKPVGLMNFFNSSRDGIIREKLESAGVPLIPAASEGFKLLRYLKDFVQYDCSKRSMSLAIPGRNDGERTALSEFASKKELEKFGVKVPFSVVVNSTEQLEKAAAEAKYPVVAKIESPDILHKSDIGGVKLNLQSAEELREAYNELLENAKKNAPGARINGVLVEQMLPKGVEVIVGVNNDPQFGPMILCGLGGVFVEVFKDVSLYPAPLNKQEALEMIKALKGYKMLCGYRGSAKCDVEALAELLVQISDFAAANKDSLLELDINPVFVHQEGMGVNIADALMVKKV
ncbi:MAG: acetate--CoA ligase family protein [Candidatus Heteroscillospira sp.]|jgi:acyl-CoA synthetase (NDP forming)